MMDVPTIIELVTSYTIRIAALESELARVREQNHRLRNVLSGPGNAIVGYAQSATLLQGYANWSTALIEYADRLGEAIDRELAAKVEE